MDEFTQLKALYESKLDLDSIRTSRKISIGLGEVFKMEVTESDIEETVIRDLIELLKVDAFDLDIPEMIEILLLDSIYGDKHG